MSYFRNIFLILSMITSNLCFAYYAYVPDSSAQTVFVIDTTTNNVIDTVSTGILPSFQAPSCIVTSPDGNSTYVGDFSGSLYVIDTNPNSASFNTVTAVVPLPSMGGTPFSVAITPNGKTVYVGTDSSIQVFDTLSQSFIAPVTGTIIVEPVFSMAIYQDGSYAYALDIGSGLYVINTDSTSGGYNTAINVIPGMGLTSIAFTPDGQFAFASAAEGEVFAIFANPADMTWNQFAGTFNVPSPFTAFAEPWALTINPEGSLVFILDVGNQCIYTADAENGQIIQQTSVALALDPPFVQLGVVPDGSAVYITPFLPVIDVMDPTNYSISTVTNTNVVPITTPGGVSFVNISVEPRAFKRPSNRR
jgi:YVTN family beta-propeller protein